MAAATIQDLPDDSRNNFVPTLILRLAMPKPGRERAIVFTGLSLDLTSPRAHAKPRERFSPN